MYLLFLWGTFGSLSFTSVLEIGFKRFNRARFIFKAPPDNGTFRLTNWSLAPKLTSTSVPKRGGRVGLGALEQRVERRAIDFAVAVPRERGHEAHFLRMHVRGQNFSHSEKQRTDVPKFPAYATEFMDTYLEGGRRVAR